MRLDAEVQVSSNLWLDSFSRRALGSDLKFGGDLEEV
jgi:hypothetical protein